MTQNLRPLEVRGHLDNKKRDVLDAQGSEFADARGSWISKSWKLLQGICEKLGIPWN